MWSKVLFFVVNVMMIGNTCAYVYGPIRDQIVLYSTGFSEYVECQKNFTKIKTALRFNLPTPNIPSTPISEQDVSFFLYTRLNADTPQVIRMNDSPGSIRSSYIDFDKKTVLYVHGLSQSFDRGAMNFRSSNIVDNFYLGLLPYQDVNVLITNWDSYAYYNRSYTSRITYPRLGKLIATFIQKLMLIGADAKKIHLIGYSAGGQTVAFTGKALNPKVGRITSVDPAEICYNLLPPTERISKMDADFVQIIHCSVASLAVFPMIHGHVTFIINGGILQPQCANETTYDNLGRCSHFSCEDYLYDSLSKNASLVGVKCDSYLDYLLNNCDYRDKQVLRYDTPTSITGVYYVKTSFPRT